MKTLWPRTHVQKCLWHVVKRNLTAKLTAWVGEAIALAIESKVWSCGKADTSAAGRAKILAAIEAVYRQLGSPAVMQVEEQYRCDHLLASIKTNAVRDKFDMSVVDDAVQGGARNRRKQRGVDEALQRDDAGVIAARPEDSKSALLAWKYFVDRVAKYDRLKVLFPAYALAGSADRELYNNILECKYVWLVQVCVCVWKWLSHYRCVVLCGQLSMLL